MKHVLPIAFASLAADAAGVQPPRALVGYAAAATPEPLRNFRAGEVTSKNSTLPQASKAARAEPTRLQRHGAHIQEPLAGGSSSNSSRSSSSSTQRVQRSRVGKTIAVIPEGGTSLGQVGILVSAFAAICNGSFSVPLKMARKQYPGLVDPIFQGFWAIGVGIVSLASIPVKGAVFGPPSFEFAPMGVVSGLFSALATVMVLLAVKHLGVGLPPSLYAASFIFAGLAEDIGFMGERPENAGLLAASLLLVCLAAFGIAYSKAISDGDPPPQHAVEGGPQKSFFVGVMAALMVGILGSFVPFTSKMAGQIPFGFLASFGVGILVVHTFLVPLLLLVTYGGTMPTKEDMNLGGIAPYGISSGLLWGLGNAGLNFALTAGTPFSVAVSLYQCGLFVSGLWGILKFGEIRGFFPISVFCSAAVLLFVSIYLEGVAMP